MRGEGFEEELDRRIEQMIRSRGGENSDADPLLGIARELRLLPSREFRESLRGELLAQAELPAPSDMQRFETATGFTAEPLEFRLNLTAGDAGVLPADPRSLLFSIASHAAVVVLIACGIWVGQRKVPAPAGFYSKLTFLPLTAARAQAAGGSGGERSKLAASPGMPPRFREQQLFPPAIVVRSSPAQIQADPAVLGPPELKIPPASQIGDLFLSRVVIPSNGTGNGGGIGNDFGTGIGSGRGPGAGAGSEAGLGGLYRVGEGVSPPRAIYDPNPEYSEEARKSRTQGTVVVSVIVDAAGNARNVRVVRSLGMGLDQKAIEAVERWKFQPAIKDGYAVAVRVNVEVSFRLY